jgi:gluconolactonase
MEWGLEMGAPGVYAKHTDFFDLVDRGARIVKVAGGFGFTEGPVFSRIGFLLFSDLRSEKIHKYTIPAWESSPAGGKLTVYREKSNRANGLTFDHQGRLLACETGPGRVTRTEKDGTVTVLAERWGDKRLSSPNDLVYNIDGSIYFSDMPRSNVPDASERTNVPAIYRISRTQIPGKAKLEQLTRECKRANGVALGPKQNRLYAADSAEKHIRVFDLNDDGTLEKARVFAEFNLEERGSPDGLKTDESGNVYCTGPGGLWVFNPQGHHLGTIVTPEQPSNCCWGRGGLFITARTSVYHVASRASGTRTF